MKPIEKEKLRNFCDAAGSCIAEIEKSHLKDDIVLHLSDLEEWQTKAGKSLESPEWIKDINLYVCTSPEKCPCNAKGVLGWSDSPEQGIPAVGIVLPYLKKSNMKNKDIFFSRTDAEFIADIIEHELVHSFDEMHFPMIKNSDAFKMINCQLDISKLESAFRIHKGLIYKIKSCGSFKNRLKYVFYFCAESEMHAYQMTFRDDLRDILRSFTEIFKTSSESLKDDIIKNINKSTFEECFSRLLSTKLRDEYVSISPMMSRTFQKYKICEALIDELIDAAISKRLSRLFKGLSDKAIVDNLYQCKKRIFRFEDNACRTFTEKAEKFRDSLGR